jgi:hypothetical protein
MSGVFRTIDPPTPSPPAACVYPLAFGAGGGHTRCVERVGGSPDTALYSINVSTLWWYVSLPLCFLHYRPTTLASCPWAHSPHAADKFLRHFATLPVHVDCRLRRPFSNSTVNHV